MLERLAPAVIALALCAAPAAVAVAAEEEPARPWKDTAEFGLVMTSGNTETTNVSFSNKFVYAWDSAELLVDAFALRTETTRRVFSVDPMTDTLVVDEIEETTAEAYALSGKYRRNISERFFWYVAAGWDKDEFAGIDSRTKAGAGVGYRFFKTELHQLLGEFGFDYTDESRTNGVSDSFAGARAFLGYERALSETASYASDLELLLNLDDTDDKRATWVNALSASLSERMALKVAYTMKYDDQPVVTTPIAGRPDLTFEFDDLDTILSASLVVNF